MRKGKQTGLHVVLVASRGGTGQWQKCGRPGKPASRASAAWADTARTPLSLVPIHKQLGKRRAYLSDDEVLRELRKSDNLIEHFGPFFVKVTPAHEFHRVGAQLEKTLRTRECNAMRAGSMRSSSTLRLGRPGHRLGEGTYMKR